MASLTWPCNAQTTHVARRLWAYFSSVVCRQTSQVGEPLMELVDARGIGRF